MELRFAFVLNVLALRLETLDVILNAFQGRSAFDGPKDQGFEIAARCIVGEDVGGNGDFITIKQPMCRCGWSVRDRQAGASERVSDALECSVVSIIGVSHHSDHSDQIRSPDTWD